MSQDAAVPAGCEPAARVVAERAGVRWTAARWSADELARLARVLQGGRRALTELSDERLLAAWQGAVAAFLDAGSSARRRLEPVLPRLCALSPAGLAAALEAVLGGVSGEPVRRLLAAARPAADDRPVLVLLASNLPALAVQPLLPALALRRPAILKSPSSEPLFAPAFVRQLARHEPAIAQAVAALTWKGGDTALEAPLLAAAGRILAYGEQQTLDDLERRAPGRLAAFGPKTSLAAVGPRVSAARVVAGLARDVALFDQRGCLSIQAVYAAADPIELADRLAAALGELAGRWPPGPADATVVAGVQQLRAEAELRGLHRPELPLAAGTVVVEPLPEFRPGPGLRTVRVHPLADLGRLPELLAPWQGRLQGAALAGPEAWALERPLAELGVSRCAAPGDLQAADALWHNGGEHPLAVLAS